MDGHWSILPHAVLGTEIKDRQVTVEMLVKIEYLFQDCKLLPNKFKIVSLYRNLHIQILMLRRDLVLANLREYLTE